MNLFQWLTLPVLSAVLLADVVGLVRKPKGRNLRLLRAVVWAVTAVAIANPDLPQAVAHRIGIGRGADLVLYVFVLAFLGASFYFYSRYVRLQRQLTDVVRHLAIQNARHGRADDLS
jgi:small membrane protein